MGTGYHERVRAYPRHGQSCQFLGYWQALVRGMSWHPHQSRRGTPVQQASITQVTLEDATSHNVRNHSLKVRARFSISISNLPILKNWHVDNDIHIFTQQKRGVITIRQEFHPSIALYLSDETACLFKLLHKPVHDRDSADSHEFSVSAYPLYLTGYCSFRRWKRWSRIFSTP